MSQKRVSEILVETLVAAGVKRVFGVVGDSLNGILDEIGRRKEIQWIPVRHEETGAFAAGAQAHLTGDLAVCAGSCGPGNMHLINGLYDCQRSRVPVLAIAAHIPSSEIGSSYFQETHPTSFSKVAATTASWFLSRSRCQGYWRSRFRPRWPKKVFPWSSFQEISRSKRRIAASPAPISIASKRSFVPQRASLPSLPNC